MDCGLSTFRDLESDVSGTLRWDNDVVITNISLTSSLSGYSTTAQMNAWVTANSLSPLNQGTVGVNVGLSATMTANTFFISVDESTDSRTKLILRDTNNNASNITANTSGTLLFDTAPLATEVWVSNEISTNAYTHPASHAISMITGLQAELDKTNLLIDGVSPISLGDISPTTQQIAIYESNTAGYTPGTYCYGIGLVVNQVIGLGLGGGTGASLPEHSTGSNKLPDMLITATGRVGINNQNPTYTLDVTGDIRASGIVYGATKSFAIQHPDPDQKNTHRLRHWCTECDSPGGMVMYRKQITATEASTINIQMPDWFKHCIKM